MKFNLVFSTLVHQDTNSVEEFEDIFYHQSSKELLCRNYATILAVNKFRDRKICSALYAIVCSRKNITILLSIGKYFGKSICILLHCIEE